VGPRISRSSAGKAAISRRWRARSSASDGAASGCPPTTTGLAAANLSGEDVVRLAEAKAIEVEQRARRFRGDRPAPEIRGRTVILVDDGIATGGTILAAIRAVRRRGPKRLVLAVPVAASDTIEALRPELDDVVCLEIPRSMAAIGFWYRNFEQVSDEEVLELLQRSREPAEETSVARHTP
jgi:putative phosphoribosyl transferase